MLVAGVVMASAPWPPVFHGQLRVAGGHEAVNQAGGETVPPPTRSRISSPLRLVAS